MSFVLVAIFWSMQALGADFTLNDQAQLYAQIESQAYDEQMTIKASQSSSRGNVHKYAGYATLALAGITAATASSEDFHEGAAYATAASAVTTVVAGKIEHSDRFDPSASWLSDDNRHILTGALGSLLMATAVAIADDGKEGSHSTLGVAGGVLMGLAVIDIKW